MTKKQLEKIYGKDNVGDFYEGRAVVCLKSKYGHVDIDGNIITPLIYDYAGSFHENSAIVKLNDRWSSVNLDGNLDKEDHHDFIKVIFK